MGPKSKPEEKNSRKCLTLDQLTMQNMSFLSGNINSASPLSIYLSLKVHSETRSKKPVEMLHTLALGISYGKVLTIEHNFAHTVTQAAAVMIESVLQI